MRLRSIAPANNKKETACCNWMFRAVAYDSIDYTV